MKRRTLSLLALFSILSIPFHVSAQQTFSDTPLSYWAYHEIDYLSEKKVIEGYSTGKFLPGETITRKQAALMMTRALKLDLNGTPTIQIKDMNPITTGFQEVTAVVEKGMFNVQDGLFYPDRILTREEMAQILAVAYEYIGDGQNHFTDVPIDNPNYDYIDAIAANQITTGYGDGTFRPTESVTRAQFSAFLARIYNQPLKYEVRRVGQEPAIFRSKELAIDFATQFNDATVHPLNDTLNTYSDSFLSSTNTGIKNGVLIYNGNEVGTSKKFTTEYFKPYLGYLKDGQYIDPMFDSFIILGRTSPYGDLAETSKNDANFGEWDWYLNRTFDPDGALTKLNEAVSMVPVVNSVNAFISIPYPKFTGDIVTLDGFSLPNNQENRQKLVEWYIDEAMQRFQNQHYEHIVLKGFYWLNETVTRPEDEKLLETIAQELKSKEMKFIYSPHALSTNFDNWKWYGFDGAYLQANAHKVSLSEQEVKTLLHQSFLRAQIKDSGLNLEIENHSNNTLEIGLKNFHTYLETAKLYNLPGQSFIMYQGTEMIFRLGTYNTELHRNMYEELHQFLNQRS